jgi:competence protein ComEA
MSDPDLLRPPPDVSWRERLEATRDRLARVPRWQVMGAALLAIVAVWMTVVLLRPPGGGPDVQIPFTQPGGGSGSTPSTVTKTETAELVVHVAGAVAHPGVYRLRAGARAIDAVDAAGGPTIDADTGRINLAAPLRDGERVYVPRIGEAAPSAIGAGTGEERGPINLNTATVAELESLPGVGPSTAAAIVDHRERSGPFTSVEQLLDVRGIGPAKLDQIRGLVTV